MGNSTSVPPKPPVTVSAESQLQTKFENVSVNRNELILAETALGRTTASSFDYSLAHDKFIGLRKNKIQEIKEIVIRKLCLKDGEVKSKIETEVESTFDMLDLADAAESQVEQIKLDMKTSEGKFVCVYGFLTAVPNGTSGFDLAYAIYQLEFDLMVDQNFRLSVAEMEAIKMHYSKHKALQTLKQEGVIKAINYVNE